MSGGNGNLGRLRMGTAIMLRTRLFLNLAPFLLILLAVGVYALFLFPRLTADVYRTVEANYRSVLGAQRMKLAVTRLEDGVITSMDGDWVLGPAEFNESRTNFEASLREQLGNSKSSLEKELNNRLNTNFVALTNAGAEIIRLDDFDEQKAVYQFKLEPRLTAINHTLDQILDLNDKAILEKTGNTERITGRVSRSMATSVVVALVMAFSASFLLIRSILQPIRALTRATHSLGEGNLDQLLPVKSKDELGDLADSFNKMAAQLRVYQQSTAERIVRLHKTLEATIASFPDPIYILDRKGNIELLNVAANKLATALHLKDELPPQIRQTAQESLAQARSFLPHSFKEVVSYRINGDEKFYLPRVLAMRNEEDVLIGVAVVLYDVTRFRLLDDAKTNLVATVSHEIKTPLTSVRMALHLLLEKKIGSLTSRQNELVVTARDDSERLLRILNDLLDLTRLEEGNTSLAREKTSPAEMVQGATDIMRESVTNRKFGLHCDVEMNLPEVLVDRQRINHVFSNFIDNAAKYSPPGGDIIVAAKRAGEGEVQFSVIDQGPGVPEDQQDRIFDRFYRVPGQRKQGAGLGLSIAREIVLTHGGRIGVRNGPNGGSEFYFVLPSVELEPAPEEQPAAAGIP